ncbi:hypothetical protein T05_2127 [Trichinella murrelli]|uniref:Uncharacterized protein n=1 Tax=Trichinella murrelli TaxID=144512 RepID=A0A0V0TNR8_9BILA|nr:hypothetical protein T05_2127 [Trichinella murrelli]
MATSLELVLGHCGPILPIIKTHPHHVGDAAFCTWTTNKKVRLQGHIVVALVRCYSNEA